MLYFQNIILILTHNPIVFAFWRWNDFIVNHSLWEQYNNSIFSKERKWGL